MHFDLFKTRPRRPNGQGYKKSEAATQRCVKLTARLGEDVVLRRKAQRNIFRSS
jgi:hypothetical protein